VPIASWSALYILGSHHLFGLNLKCTHKKNKTRVENEGKSNRDLKKKEMYQFYNVCFNSTSRVNVEKNGKRQTANGKRQTAKANWTGLLYHVKWLRNTLWDFQRKKNTIEDYKVLYFVPLVYDFLVVDNITKKKNVKRIKKN
jgi:hypothetical protein